MTEELYFSTLDMQSFVVGFRSCHFACVRGSSAEKRKDWNHELTRSYAK